VNNNPQWGAALVITFFFLALGPVCAVWVFVAGFRRGAAEGFRNGVKHAADIFRRIIDTAQAREFFPAGTVSGAVADILGTPKPKPKTAPKPRRKPTPPPKPKTTPAGGAE
jgi:hypothetical protein